MAVRRKKKAVPKWARYRLKSASTKKPSNMVALYGEQVAKIKAAPGYGTQPAVQTACDAVTAGATALGGTLTALAKNRADGKVLEDTRDQQGIALQVQHDHLETTLNTLCAGDPQQVLAWTGEVATRVTLVASSDPPLNAVVESGAEAGTVVARCKADPTAICYLFQQGSDPAHPETWPQPVIEGGAKHTVTGLAIGTKVYFRIAVQRRGTGLGPWSDVLAITVR